MVFLPRADESRGIHLKEARGDSTERNVRRNDRAAQAATQAGCTQTVYVLEQPRKIPRVPVDLSRYEKPRQTQQEAIYLERRRPATAGPEVTAQLLRGVKCIDFGDPDAVGPWEPGWINSPSSARAQYEQLIQSPTRRLFAKEPAPSQTTHQTNTQHSNTLAAQGEPVSSVYRTQTSFTANTSLQFLQQEPCAVSVTQYSKEVGKQYRLELLKLVDSPDMLQCKLFVRLRSEQCPEYFPSAAFVCVSAIEGQRYSVSIDFHVTDAYKHAALLVYFSPLCYQLIELTTDFIEPEREIKPILDGQVRCALVVPGQKRCELVGVQFSYDSVQILAQGAHSDKQTPPRLAGGWAQSHLMDFSALRSVRGLGINVATLQAFWHISALRARFGGEVLEIPEAFKDALKQAARELGPDDVSQDESVLLERTLVLQIGCCPYLLLCASEESKAELALKGQLLKASTSTESRLSREQLSQLQGVPLQQRRAQLLPVQQFAAAQLEMSPPYIGIQMSTAAGFPQSTFAVLLTTEASGPTAIRRIVNLSRPGFSYVPAPGDFGAQLYLCGPRLWQKAGTVSYQNQEKTNELYRITQADFREELFHTAQDSQDPVPCQLTVKKDKGTLAFKGRARARIRQPLQNCAVHPSPDYQSFLLSDGTDFAALLGNPSRILFLAQALRTK